MHRYRALVHTETCILYDTRNSDPRYPLTVCRSYRYRLSDVRKHELSRKSSTGIIHTYAPLTRAWTVDTPRMCAPRKHIDTQMINVQANLSACTQRVHQYRHYTLSARTGRTGVQIISVRTQTDVTRIRMGALYVIRRHNYTRTRGPARPGSSNNVRRA